MWPSAVEPRPQTRAYHQAIGNVGDRALVRLVLVRFLDHEGVDHCGEPVDQFIEVHARSILAALRRPVVFRKAEEVVELGGDQACDPRQRSGKRILERRGRGECYRATSLGRAACTR